MCGLVGIVGKSDVAQRLFDGLKRLEYRGYDSAGICTTDGQAFDRRRAEGKLDNLQRELAAEPLGGVVGIAHTRWATHGPPTVGNAHPHIAGPVALVHNGIIENFKPLRDELIADGREFLSETDSEVVAHLVAREIERGSSPQDAVATVLPRLHGAFAIAFLFRDHPDLIIGARMGAPLTVGYGEGENYIGSDANSRPSAISSSRSGLKFSMIPLWTSATGPAMCGWALPTVGAPWVAQRVWAIPTVPGSGSPASSRCRLSSLPSARRRLSSPPSTVQMPAES